LRRVVNLDPDAPNPKFNIAFFMHEVQRYQDALKEFENLQKIYPDDPRVPYGIALSLHKMKRFTDAIPYWERYIQMALPNDPFFKKAHTFLVEAKHKQNYTQTEQ
jgi:tetratricopeptide (TPR) repeat protein